MKVTIEFETIDGNNECTLTKVLAVMEIRKFDYRLVYIEKLSEDGKSTANAEMLISKQGMRIKRQGALTSDFLYENALVHHTTYQTPYGTLPITITTGEYSMQVGSSTSTEDLWNQPSLPEDFLIQVHAVYTLTIDGGEPMPMDVRIKIMKA